MNEKILFALFSVSLLLGAVPAYGQQISHIDTTGFDSLLTEVYHSSPLLKIKKETISEQQEKVLQSKLSFLKNFKIGFQFYRSNTTVYDEQLGVVPRFGFNIQLDFESFFATPSRVREARTALRAAEYDFVQSRASLRVELLTRYATFKMALQSYQIKLEKYRIANELLSMAKNKFGSGEIPLDQYTKSIENEANAHENLLRAELDLQIAKASLIQLLEY